jgi:hypothetical protein
VSVKEAHVFVPCPTCRASGLIPIDDKAKKCLAVGLKPGTCGDWVECYDCHATGKVEIVERVTVPTAKSIVVPNGLWRD